ncbi:MAG: KpsF/GutQ family sugar-phosphate isomerase [Prevotella sp.]|nr:KpsF/GutQ family sugar-phosphate isomerase [Prevotella sp.]
MSNNYQSAKLTAPLPTREGQGEGFKSQKYAIQCIRDEAQALLDLIPHIDEDFDRAVDLILECKGKVIVTGVGKSGHIGAKIAATLASTGTPSFFINPLDVYHGDLGVMARGDVVVAISNSGQTDELLRFIPMVLHSEIPIIAMTGNAKSLLARYAACHLYVGVQREAGTLNLAPTCSTTATLAMGDALAVALMERRHFQPEDFAQFHPGGELGKRLLTHAQDVMLTDNLPTLDPDMQLGKAIILISEGKLGLGVAMRDDHIEGIVTDGDIRRAIERWEADFFSRTVGDVMTRQPKTVLPEASISEVQRVMNQHKIHSVLVTNADRRLLGIVDRYACVL